MPKLKLGRGQRRNRRPRNRRRVLVIYGGRVEIRFAGVRVSGFTESEFCQELQRQQALFWSAPITLSGLLK